MDFILLLFQYVHDSARIGTLVNWHRNLRKPARNSLVTLQISKFLHQETFGDRASVTGSFEEFIGSRELRLHRGEWNPIRRTQTVENNSRERYQLSVQKLLRIKIRGTLF